MPPCVSCLCVGAACGGTQIFTSSSGSFFLSYGGLYLFIRTLAVNRDSVSSTAPLANFQWQNYNSCPSIELCRSGVVQLYSCHWASCGRARFSRVILMFFLFFLKNIHGWLLENQRRGSNMPVGFLQYHVFYGCHLALIQQRFENLVRDVSGDVNLSLFAFLIHCFPLVN